MPNIFEQNAQNELKHFDASAIFSEAVATNAPSLRQVVLAHADMDGLGDVISHAATYGIADKDTSEFPNYAYPYPVKTGKYPYIYNDDAEWVSVILNGVTKVPNTRLKTFIADITGEAARAMGYTKGKMKKEAIIKSLTRETTAKTIYVKQKADRDDILDITDFDYVALLRESMRIRMNEELARAIIWSDGRDASTQADDKISEDAIRPVVKDDELYLIKKEYSDGENIVDLIYGCMEDYHGSGNLTCFMSYKDLAPLMTKRDSLGHRLYRTEADLAAEMGVKRIVTSKYATAGQVVCLDLADYKLGANRGGDMTMFDDFDIDFNQYKYLLETRRCGSLVVPKSAIVLNKSGE